MTAAVRLLGHIHDALALELASVGAAFVAPDATQPSSFDAVKIVERGDANPPASPAPELSPRGTAASVDRSGSAGDPEGPVGSHPS